MDRISRAIQALIAASAVLGVALLAEVYTVVPPEVLGVVGLGWVLFVFDTALTFVRPRASFYLGLLLAALALATSLPESAHWAFIQNGLLIPSAIFVIGSILQALIIVLVSYYVFRARRKDEWAWPGAKSAI